MKKKVLIFYIETGTGHKKVAKTIAKILKEYGENKFEIIQVSATQLTPSKEMDIIEWIWNFLLKKNMLKTAEFLYNFLLRLVILPFLDITIGPSTTKKIDRFNPDIIVSTAAGWNKALNDYCQKKQIPFYIFITEAFPHFTDTIGKDATHLCYFKESCSVAKSYDLNLPYYSKPIYLETKTKERIKYLLNHFYTFFIRGHKNKIFRPLGEVQKNNVKCVAVGPLADKKFFIPLDKNLIKEKLEIKNNFSTVVIMSGGIGGSFILKNAITIKKKYEGNLNIIAMCGNDIKCYQKLKKYSKDKNSRINIIPLKFVDNVNEILSLADVIICRASSNTFIESLLSKTPVMASSLTTSNDDGCLEMITKYQLGKIFKNQNQLITSLKKIIKNKEKYKNNIISLFEQYPTDYQGRKKIIFDTISGNEFNN